MGDEHDWGEPYKILLLGGRGLGKTSIDFQIRHNDFRLRHVHHDSSIKENFIVDGVGYTFSTLAYKVGKY